MLEIQIIDKEADFKNIDRDEFVDFLFTHLGSYGDPKIDIQQCLDYAFSEEKYAGGFILVAIFEGKLAGALIMNKTGMGNYIPDWILVYIAVDTQFQGKGIGKQMIEEVIKLTKGRIKLHVEYNNPAKKLYERLGFTSKYAEMRYENILNPL